MAVKYLLVGLWFFHCWLVADSEQFVVVEPTEAEKFIAQIRQETEKVRSVAFCFRQEKHLVLFEDTLHLRGWCYVEKPDKIRWEYVAPLRKRILLCRDEVKVYKGAEEIHVAESQGLQMVYKYILAFLSGRFDMDRSRFISTWRKNDRERDVYWLELKSQGKLTKFVDRMEMKISKQTRQLVQFRLFEPNGDYTVIEVESYLHNPRLCPDLFGKKVIENFQDAFPKDS